MKVESLDAVNLYNPIMTYFDSPLSNLSLKLKDIKDKTLVLNYPV